MPPAEQPIEVAKFFVKIVIALGPDDYRIDDGSGRSTDDLRQGMDPCIGSDPLAVRNSRIKKFSRDWGIDVDAGNDQRSKEIAFSALIDAEMRLEHFRRMNLLVAEFRLFENFWLQ